VVRVFKVALGAPQSGGGKFSTCTLSVSVIVAFDPSRGKLRRFKRKKSAGSD
jgi:hypothetical protein